MTSIDEVKAGLAAEQPKYTAKKNDKKNAGRFYRVLMDIYAGDTRIKEFYKCKVCNEVLNHNPINGTAPLLRHADSCDPLPSSSKDDEKKATNVDTVMTIADPPKSPAKSEEPKGKDKEMWSVAFSNKRGLMAQVIAESSRVFHKTGPIDEKTVAKFLVRNATPAIFIGKLTKWANEMELKVKQEVHEKTDSDGDSNGDDKENEPKPSELPQQTKDNLGNVEENKDKSKNIKRKVSSQSSNGDKDDVPSPAKLIRITRSRAAKDSS